MRRLRALLPFAGRRSRAAVGNARPAPVGQGAGRVDRRRLLGLIGAAPIALPAAVRAALSAEPFPSRVVGWSIVGADLQKRALVLGDLSAMSYADLAAARLSATLACLSDPCGPDILARDIERERADLVARGVWRSAVPNDVGSGL